MKGKKKRVFCQVCGDTTFQVEKYKIFNQELYLCNECKTLSSSMNKAFHLIEERVKEIKVILENFIADESRRFLELFMKTRRKNETD